MATFRLFLDASGGDPGQNTSMITSRGGQGLRWVSRYPNSERQRALGQSSTATSSRATYSGPSRWTARRGPACAFGGTGARCTGIAVARSGTPSTATGTPSTATGTPSTATGAPVTATGTPSTATGTPSRPGGPGTPGV